MYSLHERYKLLKAKWPQYLVHDPVFNELLCEVPVNAIKHHHKPIDHLRKLRGKKQLTRLEKAAVSLAELLKKSHVPWIKLGVTGSLLIGIYTTKSDVDLIVYGTQNCHRVYDSLKTLLNGQSSQTKAYNTTELKQLFDFRSRDTDVSFEDFVRTESRKVLQGKFEGYDYFIRCVKDWTEINEKYGATHYLPAGYAKINAQITDDSQMIFTPCHYKIGNVDVVEGPKAEPIHEIVSFRGRFCEHARNGETVEAQGKLEKVQMNNAQEFYRLLLGSKKSDYMILTKEA